MKTVICNCDKCGQDLTDYDVGKMELIGKTNLRDENEYSGFSLKFDLCRVCYKKIFNRINKGMKTNKRKRMWEYD